jgi:GAF domain-containing protein
MKREKQVLEERRRNRSSLRESARLAELRGKLLATLYAVEEAVGQQAVEEQLLPLAVERALSTLEVEVAVVFVREDEEMVLRAHHGVSPEAAAQVSRIPLTDPVVRRLLRKGSVVLLEVDHHPLGKLRYLLKEGRLTQAIIAPLLCHGTFGGAIGVATSRKRVFSPEELHLVGALGRHLALTLENIRLLKRLERRAERRAALNRITRALSSSLNLEQIYPVLSTDLRQVVDFDRLSVALLAGDKNQLEVVRVFDARIGIPPPGMGLSLEDSREGEVVRRQQAVIVRHWEQEQRFPADEAFLAQGLRSAIFLPLVAAGETLGVLSLSSSRAELYSPEDLEVLQPVADQLALAIHHARLYQEEKSSKEEAQAAVAALRLREAELLEAYSNTIQSLVLALEARDPYTRGHSERVRLYCRMMARHLGRSQEEMEILDRAAQLHDVGKVGIRDSILLKPESLEPWEWAQIKLHPEKGVELVRHLPFLKPCLPLIRSHHERYDGRGYPQGIAGEDIPWGARILAVADAYDALTSERPYRSAYSHQQAMEILHRGAGSQWDPQVIKAFSEAVAGELGRQRAALLDQLLY